MQHSQDLINKFIELRSQLVPYSQITQELQIARSTAFLWARQHKTRIDNIRALQAEAIQEQILGSYEQRIKTAVARLRRYEQEMDSRQTKYMDMKELQMLILDARKEVEKLTVIPKFVDEPPALAPNTTATQ